MTMKISTHNDSESIKAKWLSSYTYVKCQPMNRYLHQINGWIRPERVTHMESKCINAKCVIRYTNVKCQPKLDIMASNRQKNKTMKISTFKEFESI